MTKIENSSQTSTIVSKETDNISKNSFLHRYYVNIMENTEQSSVKIERAAKFLLLPEISKLTDDHTKAMFLLSKGLTHDEVLEAFKHYYKKQKRKLTPSVPELVLHNVNQVESNPQNTIQVRHASSSQSGLSIFLNLCQRMIFLAGISTAVYYLYQKWCTSRATDDNNKKERQRIEEELNHIKSELQKISADLKAQQAAGKTSANILSEINSLKAILVSRQYFEEKQNTKLSLPSWQLNNTASTSSSIKNGKSDTNTPDKKSIVASTVSIESTPTNSTSSEQNISPIEEVTPNKNDKAEPQTNGNVELAKDSISSSKQNIQSEEKITSPSEENNDVKRLENGVCEEKVITNGEYISDTPQKPKKNGTKNRPSKSKITDNGNKNTHKQNGVAKVDVN